MAVELAFIETKFRGDDDTCNVTSNLSYLKAFGSRSSASITGILVGEADLPRLVSRDGDDGVPTGPPGVP